MKLKKIISFFSCLAVVVSLTPVRPAMAQYQQVQILKGDVHIITTKNLSRVSVTDPTIVDINDAKPQQVVLIGKEPGQTALFIWDDSGKQTYVIRVMQEEPSSVRDRLAGLLTSAGIRGVAIEDNMREGKVVLSGTIPEEQVPVLERILDPFADNVINFVKKEVIQDLIQIDMQITELSTTLSKELGVDWTTSLTTNVFNPTISETLPNPTGEFKDLFKLGDFNRTNALTAKINALIIEGKAKLLSKPRLVVVNGKEATFLVGGEIPIRTTTTNATGGSTQENIEFKEYGVSMAITPTIKDGKVDILLNVEISDIDASRPTEDDVAFLTRSAQTQLLLDDRQTIVLAGLIKKNKSEQVRRIPFLSAIPIVGLLFRSIRTPVDNGDTEVVISLTPTIIRASTMKPVAATEKVVIEETASLSEKKIEKIEPVDLEKSVPVPAPTDKSDEQATITKNAGNASVMVPAEIQPYARSVQEKISSAIAYPYEAQENNWQGTVKLSVIIRKDGSLRDIVVKESSGYDVFDQDAMNTAQILAPYDPFPEDMKEEQLTITIPIVYSLDAFLKNVAKRK